MTISIIIPCRNERRYIRQFMDALRAQELDTGWRLEVLLADGMSNDGTREILAEYQDTWGEHSIQIMDNPNQIVSTGLNAAIDASTGEVLIRMDVHTVYADDYILECVRALQASGADSVGGPWVAQSRGLLGRVISAAFHSKFCNGGAKAHNPAYEGEVDTVYLGCWRRETFDKAGMFDPDLVRNQDDEFHFRLKRAGGRIWQSPKIRSWYSPRESFKSLFRQYLQYGFWKVAVLRKHGRLAAWRHVVPAMFVASLVAAIAGLAVSYAFGAMDAFKVFAVWLVAEVAVYASFAIGAAWSSALSWKGKLLLPPVIAVYHLSYGLGFLAGLLTKPKSLQEQNGTWFTALSR